MELQFKKQSELPVSEEKYLFFSAKQLKRKILTGIIILMISQNSTAQPLEKGDANLITQKQTIEFLVSIDVYYQNGIVYMNWTENILEKKIYQNALWVSKAQGDFLSVEISKDNHDFTTLGIVPLNQLSDKLNIMSKDGNYYKGLVFFKFSLLNKMNQKITETTVPVLFNGQKEIYGNLNQSTSKDVELAITK